MEVLYEVVDELIGEVGEPREGLFSSFFGRNSRDEGGDIDHLRRLSKYEHFGWKEVNVRSVLTGVLVQIDQQ